MIEEEMLSLASAIAKRELLSRGHGLLMRVQEICRVRDRRGQKALRSAGPLDIVTTSGNPKVYTFNSPFRELATRLRNGGRWPFVWGYSREFTPVFAAVSGAS